MKETGKVFGVLQRVGRAFMLPIAVLPVAGLLLGIGRSLTNEPMLRAYHPVSYTHLHIIKTLQKYGTILKKERSMQRFMIQQESRIICKNTQIIRILVC